MLISRPWRTISEQVDYKLESKNIKTAAKYASFKTRITIKIKKGINNFYIKTQRDKNLSIRSIVLLSEMTGI